MSLDEEKGAMMVAMDAAALVAETELRAMSQHVTVPVARWFLKHYAQAGHKRLGRLMVSYAKAMKDTTPANWADADN
jgi:hypothetical protein